MDVAKAIALGGQRGSIGTAELVSLECVRCANCESGRGCARGIASTDPELGYMIQEEWVEHRPGQHVYGLAQAVVRNPETIRFEKH